MDLTGKIGVCSQGRIGRITGKKELPWGESWVGFGIFDGEPWASRDPRIVCPQDDKLLRKAAEGILP